MGELLYLDCIKVQGVYAFQGQLLMNRHYFQCTDVIDNQTLVDAGFGYAEWYKNQLKFEQVNDCSLVKVIVSDVSKLFGRAIDYTVGLPYTGMVESPPLPANVSLAVKWSTGERGRSNMGRTFHIGMSISDVDGSIVIGQRVPVLRDTYSELITLYTAGDKFHMVIASSKLSNIGTGFGKLNRVESCSIEGFTDSQRRRLIGRGR